MENVIIPLVCVPILLITLFGIIYLDAKNDWHLAFRKTGEIKLLERGRQIIDVIIDESRDTYDRTNDTYTPNSKTGLPTRSFGKLLSGYAWVSLFYPYIKVAQWQFYWPKLVPVEQTGKNTKKEEEKEGFVRIEERYRIIPRNEPVSTLFGEYVYPIRIDDIELDGNVLISILVNVTVQVVHPIYLVGYLKGKFITPAETEISGMIDNGLKGKKYEDWRKEDKNTTLKNLIPVGKPILNGSLKVKNISYVLFDLFGNSKEMRDALDKQAIKKQEGMANVIAANYEAKAAKKQAQATETLGQAQAKSIEARLQAAQKIPGGLAAYQTELMAAAVKDFSGETLIMGDAAGTRVAVQTGGSGHQNPKRTKNQPNQQQNPPSQKGGGKNP